MGKPWEVMSHSDILTAILGMCLVSYLPRVLPPLFLAHRELPPVVGRWLKYVPTAVFGALVFSEIFTKPGHGLDFSLGNPNVLPSILVVIVAGRTHSLGKSIVTGLAAYWLLQLA